MKTEKTHKKKTSTVTEWFARCKYVAKMGPYKSQEDAFKELMLTPEMRDRTGHYFPAESFVWCETRRK